nr:PREDICTED: mpv17-like protein 2 [Rhinolophus sinicus]
MVLVACGRRVGQPLLKAVRCWSPTHWTAGWSWGPGAVCALAGDQCLPGPEVPPVALREHVCNELHHGPLLHYCDLWLDFQCPACVASQMYPGRSSKSQLVASPVLGIWYFLSLGCLEDPTLCESYQGLRDKFGKLYKADWCVWPSAQLMNFLFVLPQF